MSHRATASISAHCPPNADEESRSDEEDEIEDKKNMNEIEDAEEDENENNTENKDSSTRATLRVIGSRDRGNITRVCRSVQRPIHRYQL